MENNVNLPKPPNKQASAPVQRVYDQEKDTDPIPPVKTENEPPMEQEEE